MSKLTPMMRQYQEAKAACGDALLLFRMGDFYELFFGDAEEAAKKLGLTLTSRDKGENPVPMAGFPHHQLDGYLAKLIRLGYRVAVCEQVEDPRQAKGLVKRQLTRIVSPGTVTDQQLLDPRENNFLAALVAVQPTAADGPPRYGLAWIDVSTGLFAAAVLACEALRDQLARLAPAEILVAEGDPPMEPDLAGPAVVSTRPDWTFGLRRAEQSLCRQFAVASLDGFGFDQGDEPAIRAAGAIIEYVQETDRNSLDHVDRLLPCRRGSFLEIDQATWRSLEIARTIRDQSREGSLLGVIDRCVTSMGSRLLAAWVAAPLTDLAQIDRRLEAVNWMLQESGVRGSLRQQLQRVHDVERLATRIRTGRASPRDLQNINHSLARLPAIIRQLEGELAPRLAELRDALDPCADLCGELDRALVDECPNQTRDGNFISPGYDSQLDELRELARGGKKWIAQYQATLSQRTGIAKLKVGYNKVFGYYLEVSNVHRDKVPADFIRKQTLKHAERFITPELKEYEEKVLRADQQATEREFELFLQLRQLAEQHAAILKSNARMLAALDLVCGLAELAERHNYCRPELSDDTDICIEDGRHPVLDIVQPLGSFVPNDTRISAEDGAMLLITGPNMSGKSTYIRQVALITLLAQIGSFVPARLARIGIADRIFARVGASDELSRGQSTFMVEMTEAARILNTATQRSLVILDEIGRGTSTYDGVSLAWAMVEYLHDQVGCRTLFATHYHELTELEASLDLVRNYNVTVKEWEEQVVFLHKITPGAADKSYGIHVARLAGVPSWVNNRAEGILAQLENQHHHDLHVGAAVEQAEDGSSPIQLTLFGPATHPLVEKIRRIDPDQVSPMGALQLIQQWRRDLEEE